MKLHLSPLLETFVTACNAHDVDTCLACFSGDATLQNQGHSYHGISEIRVWLEQINLKYRPTLTPVQTGHDGGEALLTTRVNGNFPGSPIELNYRFTFSNDRISMLKIEG